MKGQPNRVLNPVPPSQGSNHATDRANQAGWQVQDDLERLLAYFSKALPKAAIHYGISELEMTGITIAVIAFRYLLKKNTVFLVYTDQILLSKKGEYRTFPLNKLNLNNYVKVSCHTGGVRCRSVTFHSRAVFCNLTIL